MPLLTLSDLEQGSVLFRGRVGNAFGRSLMKMLSVDRVNDLYDRHSDCKGPEFATAVLNDIGVQYEIFNAEVLSSLPDGPFIVICNHPYGHIDGVMLVDIFGHLRPDFKVMVNKFLGRIEMLCDNFICVTPIGKERTAPTKDSIKGIKEALEHIRNGHPLGIFPSGAVSDLSLRDWTLRDREWQEPVLRLIRKLNVPIVPVHFLDRNSSLYYMLGLLDWRIRLLKLLSEIFNKKGKTVRIVVGSVITSDKQAEFTDIHRFGEFLRHEVYSETMNSISPKS